MLNGNTFSALLIMAIVFVADSFILAGEISQNGMTLKKIITAENAPDSVRFAASQLAEYLSKTCGKKLDVATEDKTSGADHSGCIFVGQSAAVNKLGLDLSQLPPDGFRIVAKDGWLVIAGSDYAGTPIVGLRNPWRAIEAYNSKIKLGAFGECGTLYGVCRFLEMHLGVRWYMPGELGTVIKSDQTINLPDIDFSNAPVLAYRYAWISDMCRFPEQTVWFRQAGFGGEHIAQIIDSFAFFTNKFKDTNPEYFALVDGRRDTTGLCASRDGGHLCLSNPKVAEEFANMACEYFDKNPAQKIYPVTPNDGLTRICGCPVCQAEIKPEAGRRGKFSNHVWKFVNTVAQKVALRHPDRLIGCLAYEHYLSPPDCLDRLDPHVAVMYCKARGRYGEAKYREKCRGELKGWLEKCSNVYCWEYYLHTWLPWRNLPVMFAHSIAEDIRWYRDNGIKGEFIEAESFFKGDEHTMLYPGMQHLNLYVTGKLYWNPDLDVDELLEEYFTLSYGPAREEMRGFWKTAEENYCQKAARTATSVGFLSGTPDEIFDAGLLEKLQAFLDEAMAKTEKDSPYARRIALVAEEFSRGRKMLARVVRKSNPEAEILRTANLDKAIEDARLTGLYFSDKTGIDAREKTLAYLAYDSKNLYLVFYCYDSEPQSLVAKAQGRDADNIWTDDCIEVFLSVDANNPGRCFQIAANCKGASWDGYWNGVDLARPSSDWNSGFTAQTKIENNRWTIKFTVPLADLGLDGDVQGRTILANFYRTCSRAGDYYATCWAPIFKPRHYTPEKFGRLIFK